MLHFKRLIIGLVLASLSVHASAQSSRLQRSAIFSQDEELQYSINFSWGIIKGKLAEASITNRQTTDGQFFSQLLMRTTSLADTFYSMRDTLETLYGADKLPRRFEKRINDNGYRSSDVSTYSYSPSRINVKNTLTVNGELSLDTTMVFNQPKREVVDLFSTIALLRTFDFVNADKASSIMAVVVLGKNKVNIEYRLLGIDSIQMPDGTKRQAMKIAIAVDDDTFKGGKNAVLVWLTRDKEQVPVLIRAELKIGAAVVKLQSYRGKL